MKDDLTKELESYRLSQEEYPTNWSDANKNTTLSTYIGISVVFLVSCIISCIFLAMTGHFSTKPKYPYNDTSYVSNVPSQNKAKTDNQATNKEKMIVKDIVRYENLIVSKKYKVTSTVKNQQGNILSEKEIVFTPEKSEGTLQIEHDIILMQEDKCIISEELSPISD